MIYLDNASASFPKAPFVSEAVKACIDEPYGNPNRTSSIASYTASEMMYTGRKKLSALISVEDSERIIFTQNATMSLNLFILGFCTKKMHILTSSMEHNSVMRPLHELKNKAQIRYEHFTAHASTEECIEDFKQKLHHKPELVIINAASNVNGAILPVNDLVNLCTEQNIPSLIDASQLIGHVPFKNPNPELCSIAFSSHKGLLGPNGLGILYLAKNITLKPLMYGGTGSNSASYSQSDILPDVYESGTQNLSAIAGLLQALLFLEKTGISTIEKKLLELTLYAIQELKAIKQVSIIESKSAIGQTAIISFIAEPRLMHVISEKLLHSNIAVRQGLHCAPLAHKSLTTLDLGGTIRISFSYFTTKEEIAIFIHELKEAIKVALKDSFND